MFLHFFFIISLSYKSTYKYSSSRRQTSSRTNHFANCSISCLESNTQLIKNERLCMSFDKKSNVTKKKFKTLFKSKHNSISLNIFSYNQFLASMNRSMLHHRIQLYFHIRRSTIHISKTNFRSFRKSSILIFWSTHCRNWIYTSFLHESKNQQILMSFMSFAIRFSNTFFHKLFKEKSQYLIQFFRTRIILKFHHSNESRHSSSILLVRSYIERLFHLTDSFQTRIYTTSFFQLNIIRFLSIFQKLTSKLS